MSELEAIITAASSQVAGAVADKRIGFVLVMANTNGEFHVSSNLAEQGIRNVLSKVLEQLADAEPRVMTTVAS